MKRLLIILMIFILIGAGVFFIGWVQIFLPAGTHTVIHTKTRGYETDAVPSGRFLWRVERLIPTNLTLYTFKLAPVDIDGMTIRGTLPSGDIYSKVMESNLDFSYQIRINAQFSLKPESLPGLVAEKALTPENLEEYYGRITEKITGEITARLSRNPDLTNDTQFLTELKRQLSGMEEYKEISIDQIHLLDTRMPDTELYLKAKSMYFALAEARETKDIAAIQAEQTNLDMLEKYGVLLTKYPVLIQYLYLKELKGEALDILELDLSELGE